MRKLTLLFALILFASSQLLAQRTISGKVTSADDGLGMPGVNVVVKGTQIGTSTDVNGAYELNVPQGATTLVFSLIGMKTQEVAIGTSNIIDIKLSTESIVMGPAVVTAMGIKREEKSLGYSAPTLRTDDIMRGQSSSMLNAMQGKVAGVNITSTAGAPGSSTRIVLRGGSSIAGNNQALLVVDGVPIDNSSIIGGAAAGGAAGLTSVDYGNRGNDINPEDIESVTVLKGPAAAALYGSRASNGALVITTKTGKKNLPGTGGAGVTFSSSIAFQNILKLPDFQNKYGEGYDNNTFDPKENWSWGLPFNDSIRAWGQEINGKSLERPYSAIPNNVKDFFETGIVYTNNLSLSGATDAASYYLSINSTNSDGIMPGNYDKYNKYSIRFNGSSQFTEKISSSVSVNYTKIKSDNIQGGQADGSVYDNVIQMPRNIPLTNLSDLNNPYYSFGGFYDESGNETYGYYGAYTINPYYVLKNYKNADDVDRITGSLTLSYKPVDWIDITDRLGLDTYGDHRRVSNPKFNLIPADNTSGNYDPVGNVHSSNGFYGTYDYSLMEVINDLMITARKKLTNDITGSLMVGHNVRSRNYSELETSTNSAGLVIPGWYDLDNSNGPLRSYDATSKRRLIGLYSELNLSYKNFLFLGATARNDWSSTLPEGNNSFFYPSVNAAFVFSELLKETKVNDWLSYGKLRGSLAQVGNDADPYLLQTYYGRTSINGGFGSTIFPFNGIPGYTLGDRIGNPNLKPEITTAREIGVELGFLGRFTVDFSYYKNNSKNQILAVPISSASGFSSRVMNAGLVENKGIELLLRATVLRNLNGFTWELYGTYTHNKNEVVELDVDQVVIGGFSGMSIVAAKGMPYGTFYATDVQKTSDGHVIIDTVTGLPLTTINPVYLGSYNPKYMASLGTNLTYKGFTLTILFDTKQGGKFYSRTKDIMDFVGTAAETAEGDRDGYIFPNSVYYDEVSGTYVENTKYNFFPQDYYTSTIPNGRHILDASYIKLRELSLTYQFPKQLLAKANLTGASIGVFGNNLWIKTATENKYVDPEINSTGSGNEQGFDFTAQPSVRNYGINLKISF